MNKEVALGYVMGYLESLVLRDKKVSVEEIAQILKHIEWLTFVETGMENK